jgi:hypothetical protein
MHKAVCLRRIAYKAKLKQTYVTKNIVNEEYDCTKYDNFFNSDVYIQSTTVFLITEFHSIRLRPRELQWRALPVTIRILISF